MISNKNIPYYLIAAGLFILLKMFFRSLNTNDLIFLLKPISFMVELFTGTSSVFIENSGYFFQDGNFVIDKSCSGFNFFLICFMMLCFLCLNHIHHSKMKSVSMVLSFVASYLITILVSGSRILASIFFENSNLPLSRHPFAHEGVGIITNLSFLIIIYLIVERILIKRKLHAKLT